MKTSIDLVMQYMPNLLEGLMYTILVSAQAIGLGFTVGIVLSILRMGKNKIVDWFVNVYISFVRGTPIIVQIFIIYYALAMIHLDIPSFQSGVIALSLNSGGFIAEIIRGGLSSVPKGQYEAAKALRINKFQTLTRIIFPQIFRIILPQLLSEFISVIKISPLLSIIAVVELTRSAQKIANTTYVSLPFYITIAIMYFILNSILEFFANVLEKKVNLGK
ncbi:His/Glu/Gln/Arg/opine family amino acid ABC transporter permease subunit [Clostridium algifaecis]|uniref:His/Glu/Gln/Arg/opine family amino acid ABC transporter permease subunit n=1 Tax=Clostridium algifaecis TaxID=1472040 RepID=A0ABS4KPL1_9CLOT|nr:amino acid ABC transporter permease [Clostridium algifaecis]MBP2031980.1 His/Glu/Gln/Arg/opine family amino acid ABC transporter permease subunit [Clostridium algifaecis]